MRLELLWSHMKAGACQKHSVRVYPLTVEQGETFLKTFFSSFL